MPFILQPAALSICPSQNTRYLYKMPQSTDVESVTLVVTPVVDGLPLPPVVVDYFTRDTDDGFVFEWPLSIASLPSPEVYASSFLNIETPLTHSVKFELEIVKLDIDHQQITPNDNDTSNLVYAKRGASSRLTDYPENFPYKLRVGGILNVWTSDQNTLKIEIEDDQSATHVNYIKLPTHQLLPINFDNIDQAVFVDPSVPMPTDVERIKRIKVRHGYSQFVADLQGDTAEAQNDDGSSNITTPNDFQPIQNWELLPSAPECEDGDVLYWINRGGGIDSAPVVIEDKSFETDTETFISALHVESRTRSVTTMTRTYSTSLFDRIDELFDVVESLYSATQVADKDGRELIITSKQAPDRDAFDFTLEVKESRRLIR